MKKFVYFFEPMGKNFFIKANSVEYVDKQGFLHENFYLILVGYLFLFAGIIVLIAGGIVYLRNKHKH